MRSLLETIRNVLHAALLLAQGRLRFEWGRSRHAFAAAERSFRRLIAIDASSYGGHLHLGLIHEANGHHEAAVRELRIAARLAPRRFRRERLPQDLVREVLREDGDQVFVPPWSPSQARSSESLSMTPRREVPCAPPMAAVEPTTGETHAPHRFVRDESERRRLGSLEPISMDEISAIDWQEFERRLADGTDSGDL